MRQLTLSLAWISHSFRREAQREPCSGKEGADFGDGLCEYTLPAAKIKPDAANAWLPQAAAEKCGKSGLVIALLTLAVSSAFCTEEEWGSHQYIQYLRGNLPIVLTAPHGGELRPREIPDRKEGVTARDTNTTELALQIADALASKTNGKSRPHIIISHLHRSKLDPNREIVEAAQGDTTAERAWQEYHDFVRRACTISADRFGMAFLMDIHGHGHIIPQVELGYLHSAQALAQPAEVINSTSFIQRGSLSFMMQKLDTPYSEILSGPHSLGTLLEQNGYRATPSARLPTPSSPFFSGGYTLTAHCTPENRTSGLQIESPMSRFRDTPANRTRYAQAWVATLNEFFQQHFGCPLHP